MAVITNQNTASAAELFAATIRDMKKGPLVGNTTFGKGVMQTTYFLTDGSCVRLTTGYYYPAGGVCYDKDGLAPDYEVTPTEEEQKNMYFLGDGDPYIKKALEVIEVE
jgi:carboxyl-terminal processing protease